MSDDRRARQAAEDIRAQIHNLAYQHYRATGQRIEGIEIEWKHLGYLEPPWIVRPGIALRFGHHRLADAGGSDPNASAGPRRRSAKPKEPTRRRLLNIAKRMADGDVFYVSVGSPRITTREIRALEALGLYPQEEHGLHEDHIVYLETGDRTFRLEKDEIVQRWRDRIAELEAEA